MANFKVLNYDVPANLKATELPRKVHPSAFLRKLGARINLSAWVLPEENVPWVYLDELTQAGVAWTIADDLITIVKANMEKEIKDVGQALAQSIAKQDKRLAEQHEAAETGDAAETVRKKYLTAAKVAVQRTKRLLKEYEQAAAGFGLDFGSLLSETRQTAETLKTGAAVKAHLYAQAAKGLVDPALAKAAQDGTLPGGVMLDALIDQNTPVSDQLINALAG